MFFMYVLVQVAASDASLPFRGIVATAVHANPDSPRSDGSYATTLPGFSVRTCTDGVSKK